jgi:hypothetical protein
MTKEEAKSLRDRLLDRLKRLESVDPKLVSIIRRGLEDKKK